MNMTHTEKLWDSILEFAFSTGELFGYGECSDREEKYFLSNFDDLVLQFYETTNYLPCFRNGRTIQENFRSKGVEFLLESANWKLE